jgi:hypothetical protein
MSLIFKISGALVFLCPIVTRAYICKPFKEPIAALLINDMQKKPREISVWEKILQRIPLLI